MTLKEEAKGSIINEFKKYNKESSFVLLSLSKNQENGFYNYEYFEYSSYALRHYLTLPELHKTMNFFLLKVSGAAINEITDINKIPSSIINKFHPNFQFRKDFYESFNIEDALNQQKFLKYCF